MRSQLTRYTCRRIVNNALYSNTPCWFPATPHCLRALRGPAPPRRTLFGFGRKPKRQPKPVDFEPGFESMLELSNRLSMEVRAPPSRQLAQAFVDFFSSKHRAALALEDIQARHALHTFQYLQRTDSEDVHFGLASEDLRMALGTLKHVGRKNYMYEARNALARAIFEELKKRREALTDEQQPPVSFDQDLLPFIQVMARFGDALYARDLVEEYWEDCLKHVGALPWSRVVRGLILENNFEELQKTVDMMQKYNIPFDPKFHENITVFYARQANMEMTKKWYQHPIAYKRAPTNLTNVTVLKLCISQGEIEWGDPIFKSLIERTPEEKAPWDVIFQWAAAQGRSVDEVERMMQVMVRRQEEKGPTLSLDMETFNGLIELANSRNDSYTAERYVALGRQWGFSPNARTYLLQLDYRIKVGDLGGARAAYSHLRGEEVVDSEDLPLLNKLIRALCTEKRQNYDAIMGLVEDLEERKARFEPETVASLSLLRLERGEMEDLVDLLNTHVFHYDLDQRAPICEVLVSHVLDHNTPTSRAWDTYTILRQTFPEIDIPLRTSLMQHFFTRKRSDMATQVFGHMRQQQVKSLRPTVSTYVACLSGIAKAGDLESLRIVHNMMKLDSEFDPNTQLNNAFMLAYTGCGEPGNARGFWEDIVHSREGPSYASIQIALRACEKMVHGQKVAKDIWGRLRRFEIEVTREIYAAYVGALAGHNLFTECVELINDAEKQAEYKPDALL